MRGITASIALCLLFLLARQGEADVLGSSGAGFLVSSEATIGGTPAATYDAFVNHIARWWDPAHTFSGDSENLTLEAKVGGYLLEELPNNGGVRHLEVVYVSPGETIRLLGALGPLQGSGLAGSMTWSFAEHADSTAVSLNYSVGGYFNGDLQELAPVVDSVLRGQLLLKRCSHGSHRSLFFFRSFSSFHSRHMVTLACSGRRYWYVPRF